MDPSVLRTLRHLYFAKYTPSADGAYWMADKGEYDMELTDESLLSDVPDSIEPIMNEAELPEEVLGEEPFDNTPAANEQMDEMNDISGDLPVGDETVLPDEEILEDEIIVEDNSGKINLNTASKEELMMIDTVGGKAAELIMAYRDENLFENCEAITKIKGIGQKRFEKIADQITV